MPLGSDAQLDHMLKIAGGAGVSGTGNVVLGHARAHGTLEEVDAVEEGEGVAVQVRRTTLVIRRGALSALARGVTLTVDGTDYKVRDIAREDDGRMLRVVLVEA